MGSVVSLIFSKRKATSQDVESSSNESVKRRKICSMNESVADLLLRKFRFSQNNKTVNPSSLSLSSPPSSLPRNCMHNVFPSFHGADIRKSFLSHILKEFRRKGIDPFIDDNIERSKSIGPELIKNIKGSRIAIILLSKNYASSTWCLNELVEILKCRGELSLPVMAVFHEVDPSDVKKQTGYFGKVFRNTCKGKTKENIERWRQALAEVAQIAGYDSRTCDTEAELIEKIATDVSNKLFNSTRSRDFDGFIGMGSHMEKIERFLRRDLDEVRMIGIWGPAGIGKSTIARCLFSQHSHSFDLSVFMENVKAMYTTLPISSDDYSAKLHLQQKFMSLIVHDKDIKVTHLGFAQDRLNDKRVLVVLDDVDQLVQLEAVAKETRWFGHGSWIIITTQNLKLLKAHGINHIHKVDFPRDDEAFQMFCMYAFGKKYPEDGFENLVCEVTRLAGNLPLGLRVMGSYFRGMSKQEWTNALPKLRTSINTEIESILKFSYDALDDGDKDLFLHIACIFNYAKFKKVEEHLAKKFLDVRQGLNVLAEKSLISIGWGTIIRMHNLLAQLGRNIVRKQSVHEPRQRQFLVDRREICELLTDDAAGSRSVVGIYFDFDGNKDKLNISERAFEGMSNLQFLKVLGDPNTLDLPGGLDYLSRKLRLLDWNYFPMTCLPSTVNFDFLVELNIRFSKLEKLWEGIKPLCNLRWMNLSLSANLKELPDLSTATNLQKLDLSGCLSLMKLPSTIGYANNLKELNLRDCSSLINLPSSIGNATSLQKLYLSNCSSLINLPSSIGNATNLKKLILYKCSSLINLPSSIGNATNLQELDMSYYSSLINLPSSIGNATNLQRLYLSDCSSLINLPSSIGNATNLQRLHMRNCSSLINLPSSIGNATSLQELYLSNCSSLINLPSSIGNATNLQELDMSYCSSLINLPSSIGNATNLKKLNLCNCSSLINLPSSIGNATNLKELNLCNCSSLINLPSSIGNATNLEKLDLSGWSSLVELPVSIGNLQKLNWLRLQGCSKLEVLPTNINLESLDKLDLTDCLMLKSFPEISRNIKVLELTGTAIEEMPPWVKDVSRLDRLGLKGCRKLVSLPQIPDSLSSINAEDCESLETLDCSFQNPKICLNFAKCFKLNQEARDLIIQTPTSEHAVLPGREVPAYFTHRATTGGSLTIKLNERPLPTSMRFKACILLVKIGDDEAGDDKISFNFFVECKKSKHLLYPLLTEHLYIFEVEAEVTSSELVFEFTTNRNEWKIGKCGVVQLLEVPSC